MGGLAIHKNPASRKDRAMEATIGHNKEVHTAMDIKEGDILVCSYILFIHGLILN